MGDARAETISLPLDEARLWLGSAHPSVSSAQPQNVELPDHWMLARRAQASEGWYRLAAELPAVQEQLALLIPNLSGRAYVYWNGQLLGQTIPITGVGTPLVAGPLLVSIPKQLAISGKHEIDVHYVGSVSQLGFVREALITSHAAASEIYAGKIVTLVYLPITLSMVSLVVAVIFFAAYRRDPAGQGFGWLAAGLAVTALSVLGAYLSLPDSAGFLVSRVRPALFHFSFIFFLIAIYRVRGLPLSKVAQAAIGSSLVLFTAMFIVTELRVNQISAVWVVLSYAIGGYLFVQLVRMALAPPQRWIAITPLILVLVFLVHDWLGVMNQANFWADQILSIYNSALIAVALMMVLVARAKQNAGELLLLNQELEARVAAKHDELQQNFERMTHAERRQAVLSERERMVREMHDGLGGQLVSTLAMVESGRFSEAEIEAALRDSLDDLRLMVHSLDQDEAELTDLLAMIRERIEPRLNRQDIVLNWHVGDLPETTLSPEQTGNILRIVQESFTNILKHASARNIWVNVDSVANGKNYSIEISDDGRGMQTSSSVTGEGRGMANMRVRAAQLGGAIEVADRGTPRAEAAGGTLVRLEAPLCLTTAHKD